MPNEPVSCIRVCWTFDDGPTTYTQPLKDILAGLPQFVATWFLSRYQIKRFLYEAELCTLQSKGHEIGIHEIDKNGLYTNWFPGMPGSYPSIRHAVEELKAYKEELYNIGIQARFARLPGGEYSELIAYLQHHKCPPNESYVYARMIIDNHPIPSKYSIVSDEYQWLLHELDKSDLRIWNGSPYPYPLLGGDFGYNSWQAECAGVLKGRGADNVTYHQAPARRLAGISEQKAGIFEQLLDCLADGAETSLVILAHDQTCEDIEEINADLREMELTAAARNIEIIYQTMTELYSRIR